MPPLDPRILEADEQLQAGDFEAAEASYREILAENPADPLAVLRAGAAGSCSGASSGRRPGRRARGRPGRS